MFLPQVITAITGSLLGAGLARRFGAKRVYLAGLAASLVSMGLLVASTLFTDDQTLAFALLLVATACLGAGFGLVVPTLNTFTAVFHPNAIDRSVLVLNALLGMGTALAPLFVAMFVGLGFWWGLPVLVVDPARRPPHRQPSPAIARGDTRDRRDDAGPHDSHPCPLLAVRRLRGALRHLRDHERQLVPARHDD